MSENGGRARRGVALPDPGRPFFAYGLFKPGEVAFFQIKGFVGDVAPASVPGGLLIRDGVVVLDPSRSAETASGFRLEFRSDSDAVAAYDAIQQMEPATQYRWEQVGGMNVLVAVKPCNDTPSCRGAEWSGWSDPAFGPALDVVEDTLQQESDKNDLRSFYRLQAAYLLLWSSIERYVSLRYGLGKDRIVEKIRRLADEPAFVAALCEIPDDSIRQLRRVASAARPADRLVFGLDRRPARNIDYLYQVRSNVAHRGKEQLGDWGLVHTAMAELLRSFRAALTAAEADAQWR